MCTGVLIALCAVVLRGGPGMEIPSPSERVATSWSAHRQVSVGICDGVRMDVEWEYQRVREDIQICQPVQTRAFPVCVPTPLAHRSEFCDPRSC